MDAVKGLQGIIFVLLVAALFLAAGCVTRDDGGETIIESPGDAVAQEVSSSTSSTSSSTSSSTPSFTSSTIDAIDELGEPEPTEPVATSTTLVPSKPSVERVEVLHFHGNSQCNTCRTIGAYAEETVNTYFADELKSGRVYFAHVNYDLPKNRELARKYGVTGSSLWTGVYTDQGFSCKPNTAVWYKTGNKKDFMDYLKGVIETRLAGE